MAKLIAHLTAGGGTPELEIRFGNANIGAYRIFLWELGQAPKELAAGSQPRIALAPPAILEISRVSYEAIILSPEQGRNQPYSMSVQIYQGGEAVPGGYYLERGRLNPDGAKSLIGFLAFEVS